MSPVIASICFVLSALLHTWGIRIRVTSFSFIEFKRKIFWKSNDNKMNRNSNTNQYTEAKEYINIEQIYILIIVLFSTWNYILFWIKFHFGTVWTDQKIPAELSIDFRNIIIFFFPLKIMQQQTHFRLVFISAGFFCSDFQSIKTQTHTICIKHKIY